MFHQVKHGFASAQFQTLHVVLFLDIYIVCRQNPQMIQKHSPFFEYKPGGSFDLGFGGGGGGGGGGL